MSRTRAAGSFDVRELHHGSSSAAFDYRIVAKRRGYENKRLEEVNPSGRESGATRMVRTSACRAKAAIARKG